MGVALGVVILNPIRLDFLFKRKLKTAVKNLCTQGKLNIGLTLSKGKAQYY